MPNIPYKFQRLDDAEVYVSDHEIVITGIPDDDDEDHNCDHMGCSSINHVLWRSPLNKPIRVWRQTPNER